MVHSKKLQKTKSNKDKKVRAKEKQRERKKQYKKNKQRGRARLIVRNLPFAVTEDNLRSHFEAYGELEEIKILKKDDGQLVGCGFIQYKLVQSAAKARHYLNGKPFLDREIECDWALSKDKYKNKEKVEEVKIKEESPDEMKTDIKEEEDGNEPAELPCDKEDQESDDNVVKDDSEDEDVKEDSEDDKEKHSDEEAETDSDEEDIKEEDDYQNDTQSNKNELKPKVESNDIVEGKTLFIKNIPFSATNVDLKGCFSKFGPLYYALVCMDPLTEHSRGTAFVKFRNKEDADKCLQATNITLMENQLEIQLALARNELNKNSDKSKQQYKDSRNLYLVKEGVVLAGTKAAEGVSASDMAKRLQLEQYKTHMLRNLNMIVARTRLVVHNIPPSWDDSKLRTLVQKYSNHKAGIKEARIMRAIRVVDSKGVGTSKEFGFVTFTTHEAALNALRSINNNPTIFSTSKRPIVAFSIENRARLQIKEKRLHNSRIKNPKCKSYDPKAIKTKPKAYDRPRPENESEKSEFAGVSAKQGVNKMRSKFNLKTQAKLHHEQLKREKKNKKHAKKTLEEKRAEFTKQPRQKINKNKVKTDDSFSKLVNKYKTQLFGSTTSNKSMIKKKWYS